ncbi:MAG: MFS transporter [Chloroflexi bacterium]|nr:MFS transporter [Chloroflexota bacterium]
MSAHTESSARSFLPAYLRAAPPTVRRNAVLDLWGAVAFGLFFGAALQFIPVVLRNLGASTEMLALYTSQTYLGSILTSFSIVLMRRRRTKSFAVACWYAARAIFLFVGLVKQVPWLVLLTGIFWFLEAFPSPAYTRIVQVIYPEEIRGKILSLVRLGMTVAIVAITPLAGWALDAWGYRILFPLAGLMGIVSTLFFNRIEVNEGPLPPRQTKTFAGLLAIVYTNRPFVLHLLSFTVYGLGALLGFALYPVVQVDRLHLSYTQIGLLGLAQSLFWLLGFLYWGGAVDKRGGLWVMRINLLIAFFVPFSYIWATNGWMLLPAFIAQGIISAGVDLGLINTSIQLAEPEKVAEYAAVQATVIGLRGAITPFIGVWLLRLGVPDTAIFAAGSLLILISWWITGLIRVRPTPAGAALRYRWPLRFRFPRF